MKKAKFIKNMFYKTIYRASDDKYKDAVIAFTSVRYDDKSREEFVTLNKIEDNNCDEVWKDILSMKISNYDEFINNNDEWQNSGIYKVDVDKVKFYEPESIMSEGILDTIDEIEIFSVGEDSDNLSFIILHDSFQEPYCITCNSDNIDIILNKLVVNYSKLVDKGKISVFKLEDENVENDEISKITFIINETEVEVIAAKQTDQYDNSSLIKLPLQAGLNQIKNNKNIDVNYVKMVDGKRVKISEDEFYSIIDKINVKTVFEPKTEIEIDEEDIQDDDDDYYWIEEKKDNKKVKVFAGVLALVGIGAFILIPNSNKSKEETATKTNTTSTNDKSVTTSSDVIVGPNTESSVYTTTTKNSQSIVKPEGTTTAITDINTIKESSVTNSESTTKITSNENSYTTNNGYTVTNKSETKYTGTYRTINSSDMIPSQTGTNHVTKSTTNGTVTYRTVDPRDTVTAPNKPGEQVFTKDGATTTKKTTTSYNKYADLIITGEINNSGKSLVLKK